MDEKDRKGQKGAEKLKKGRYKWDRVILIPKRGR
jgi:hypothetical protein